MKRVNNVIDNIAESLILVVGIACAITATSIITILAYICIIN